MGIEVWERRPRPQRLPPGLLPSAPGVWRCRPAWAAGSWKEGAFSGAGEVGWGALPPPFFGGASSGAGVEKLNRGEMSVGKRNAQGTGEMGAGWGTPGWAECSVHGQITQVSKGEGGQDSGPWSGASQAPGAPARSPRAGLLGSRAAWGRPLARPPAPGREQLRASGPGTSLWSPNYSRAAPTGFLRARRSGRPSRWREQRLGAGYLATLASTRRGRLMGRSRPRDNPG